MDALPGRTEIAPAVSPPNAVCARGLPPPAERASNLVRQAVAAGTTASRSHADIGPDIGLRHVEALLEVKAAFAHAADFQIVAFPQYGVLAAPGTYELMDEALAMGADVVGGIDPIVQDGDLDGQLDLLFRLAEKHGVAIDPHIHDPGEAGMREIAALAERTRAAGLEGRVTVSHGFCLGACSDEDFERLAGAMAEARMSLVTHGGGASPLPPVKKLRERGVEVFVGNDDVRDTWSPYGNGDLLVRTMLLSWRSGFRADGDLGIAFDCASAAPRRVFGHDDRGIAVGAPADLFTVRAETLGEAVAQHPPRGRGVQGRPPRGQRRRLPRVTGESSSTLRRTTEPLMLRRLERDPPGAAHCENAPRVPRATVRRPRDCVGLLSPESPPPRRLRPGSPAGRSRPR